MTLILTIQSVKEVNSLSCYLDLIKAFFRVQHHIANFLDGYFLNETRRQILQAILNKIDQIAENYETENSLNFTNRTLISPIRLIILIDELRNLSTANSKHWMLSAANFNSVASSYNDTRSPVHEVFRKYIYAIDSRQRKACRDTALCLISLIEGNPELQKANILNTIDPITKENVIHYAVKGDSQEILRILLNCPFLDSHALINAPCHMGYTPLGKHIFKYYLDQKEKQQIQQKQETIVRGIVRPYTYMANLLVNHGASYITKCSHPPLHLAIASDNFEVINHIPETVNYSSFICSSKGRYPIHFANSKKMASFLIFQKDANPNVYSETHDNPLHIACKEDRVELAELLAICDIDLNVENDEKETPLSIAVKHGQSKLVKLLVLFGARATDAQKLSGYLKDLQKKNPSSHAKIKDILVSSSVLQSSRTLGLWNLLLRKQSRVASENRVKRITTQNLARKVTQLLAKTNSENWIDIEQGSHRTLRPKKIGLKSEQAEIAKPGKSPVEINTTPNGLRILSLDGGGMKGIILCKILLKLEQSSNKKLYDMFDVFCGTSTGSIIASLLACEIPMIRILRFYMTISEKIFAGIAVKKLPLEK